MRDPIPYITPMEHRVRGADADDVTHWVATFAAAWFLFVALVANWLAGG